MTTSFIRKVGKNYTIIVLPSNEYGCVYAWATLGSEPAIDLQEMSILEIKIIFSDDNLGGYVNKQNCRIWGTENSHAFIERRTQNESLFSTDFGTYIHT